MKVTLLALVVSASLGLQGQGTVVTLGTMKSTTPADWKSQPAKGLRMNQFAVGDAELVIFFFGEGSGGSKEDNIKRWKDTFVPPTGKTIDDVSKVETFKVGKADVTLLDVQGTFLSKNPPQDPNAKTERKTDYRRFGVFFACPGGPYFITLTGPAKTLEQNKKAFDEWLKNFK
jgi:hypothetical protein